MLSFATARKISFGYFCKSSYVLSHFPPVSTGLPREWTTESSTGTNFLQLEELYFYSDHEPVRTEKHYFSHEDFYIKKQITPKENNHTHRRQQENQEYASDPLQEFFTASRGGKKCDTCCTSVCFWVTNL